MNIFSFFAGAGFLDLGFELQGSYNIVFVNEFRETFNRIYRYARQNMGLPEPIYNHHIEDINEYIDGKHGEKLKNLINWVDESKRQELTGFIGGPPCPDFSVAGKNKGRDALLSGEILPQRKLLRTITLWNISSDVGLIKYIFDVASFEEDLANRI